MANRGTFEDWQERLEVIKACADIIEYHSFDGDKGLCTDFGKQEGNPIQTIYFYNQVMGGDHGKLEITYADGSWLNVLRPSFVECDIFGNLPGHFLFEVSGDAQGLIFGQWVDEERLTYLEKERELNSEEDED